MKRIVLSAAFIVVGSFAMAQQTMTKTPQQSVEMQQKKAEKMKQMQQELNLTDAQMMQIKDLKAKKQAQRAASETQSREGKMQMMKQNRQQWNADMQKILTPEQYQKWQSKMDKSAEKRTHKMHRMDTMPAKN